MGYGRFKLLLTASALTLGPALSAAAFPLVTDVNATIYRDLSEWEAEGLCDPAFMIRPYPPALVRQMLEQVAANGDVDDRERAEEWLQEFGGPPVFPAVVTDVRAGATTHGASLRGDLGPELRVGAPLLPWLWAVGRIGVYGHVPNDGKVDPAGESAPLDIAYADGNLSDAGAEGTTIGLLNEAGAYAGTERYWFGAAVTRSSFGPFFENGVVIGPQAPSTVNYTLQGRFGRFRFSMGLFELVKGGDVPQASGKHAVIHDFSFAPTPNLDIGLLEAIVFANRLDPLYLVPLGSYFVLQARSGYSANDALGDNSMVGVHGTWRFLTGLRAKALVFVDDLEFNEIVRGNLDTKWNVAVEAGIEWAPRRSRLRLMSADYTLVMPYAFTHYYARDDSSADARANNEQSNWTTYGQNWGPALLPNSDRVELRARVGLANRVDLDLIGRVIRHGNASAGVRHADPAHDRPGDAQDGGLFDDGWFYADDANTVYAPSYQQPYDTGTTPAYARFLTQHVIEVVVAGGLGVTWRPRFNSWLLELSGRYLLESVRNETVEGFGPVPGRNIFRHYLGFSGTWSQ